MTVPHEFPISDKTSRLLCQSKCDRRQRWQGNGNGIGLIHPGDIFCVDTTPVARIATAIVHGIGIQNFLVMSLRRDTQPILLAGDGGEIDHHEYKAITVFAQKAQHGLIRIVAIDPFESLPIKLVTI